jgi:type IV pilus assembly protein PilB
MTVEDPIEYVIPTIRQTAVNPKAGLSFGNALRSAMRQDPDIILVGEIRDTETADWPCGHP